MAVVCIVLYLYKNCSTSMCRGSGEGGAGGGKDSIIRYRLLS